MSYLVLARKWRPKVFADLVGQAHVARTLENAIRQERVAHAYLFAGPRGVGKTSTARILAAALNCEKGPTPEPCGECGSCVEVAAGRSMDVLEIDGASNRGIDEIRDLRENVRYMASAGKRKVYIIDEVHMLTTEAFNALLKTLEEPPAHVIFVFATTRPTKVPATILSRTIRFDFRRVESRDIIGRLKTITEAEGIEADEKALHLVARAADGSMRDALSLLEQSRAYGGGVLRAEETEEALGVIDVELLFDLSEAAHRSDPKGAVNAVHALTGRGRDPVDFLLALEEHFRNLLVARVCDDAASMIDAPEETVARYKEDASRFEVDDLIRMLSLLGEGGRELRLSPKPRLALEMLLLRLVRMESTIPLGRILERLEGGASAAPSRRASAARLDQQRAPRADPLPATGPGGESARREEPAEPEPAPSSPPEGMGGEDHPRLFRDKWDGFLRDLRDENAALASLLRGTRVSRVTPKDAELAFPKNAAFHMEQVFGGENRAALEQAFERFFQVPRRLRGVLGDHEAEGERERRAAIKNDPRVGKILDMLDGEIVG